MSFSGKGVLSQASELGILKRGFAPWEGHWRNIKYSCPITLAELEQHCKIEIHIYQFDYGGRRWETCLLYNSGAKLEEIGKSFLSEFCPENKADHIEDTSSLDKFIQLNEYTHNPQMIG